MTKCRTTHHLACDCREQYFKELEKQADKLAKALHDVEKHPYKDSCHKSLLSYLRLRSKSVLETYEKFKEQK